MGSSMVVWFEAPDLEKAFVDVATAGNASATGSLTKSKEN